MRWPTTSRSASTPGASSPTVASTSPRARALLAGYRARAAARAGEIEALPLLARGAALRFLLTRLFDWLNVPPGALVKPQGSAGISRASCASISAVRSRRRLRPRSDDATSASTILPTAPAAAIRARAAGARSCASASTSRSSAGGEPDTTNNRMELMARDPGAGGAETPLQGRAAHRQPICARRHHRVDPRLEAQRLAHRRQEAGEERSTCGSGSTPRRRATRSTGAG